MHVVERPAHDRLDDVELGHGAQTRGHHSLVVRGGGWFAGDGIPERRLTEFRRHVLERLGMHMHVDDGQAAGIGGLAFRGGFDAGAGWQKCQQGD